MPVVSNLVRIILVLAGLVLFYNFLQAYMEFRHFPGQRQFTISELRRRLQFKLWNLIYRDDTLTKAFFVGRYRIRVFTNNFPRIFFSHSSLSVGLFTLGATFVVFHLTPESTKLIATATALYASLLFFREFFTENPLLKLHPLVFADYQNNEVWIGVQITNSGQGDAHNIKPKYRVLDKHGTPLTKRWKDIREITSFEAPFTPHPPIRLGAGETSKIYDIHLKDTFGIIESQPTEIDNSEVEFVNVIFADKGLGFPFYIELKTESSSSFPWLDDREFVRINPPGDEDVY